MARVMADLLAKARAGDGNAFRDLTAPHRTELQVHCYRMLGSLHDAEDALQNTMLAAWQGLDGFEGRASIRTWLYRIATNQCLSLVRSTKRRPAEEWKMPDIEPPQPSLLSEIVWLEPYPDSQLALSGPVGPEAQYEQTEAISLAFVTALQVLPARQRAVLILREVLGYHADEVAEMLDTTVDSVTSALKRARAGLRRNLPASDESPAVPDSPAERELVTRFVRAYQAGDVDALVELLTADVRLSMPPIPLEYHGISAVARFYASVFGRGRRYDLIPTRANGQPAFGAYLRSRGGGTRHAAGLLVVTTKGDRISGLTRFDNDLLPHWGMPRSLPAAEIGGSH